MNQTIHLLLNRLTAFAAALLSVSVAPAYAQSSVDNSAAAPQRTVENTAYIEWDAGNARVSRPSNRVTLNVGMADPTSARLQTFQLNLTGGGQPTAVAPTQCVGTNGTQTISLGGAFADYSMSALPLEPSTKIRAGEPLAVAVTSAADNRDATRVETKTVTIATPSGDKETLTLTESGVNTGVFFGVVQTAAIPPQPMQGDCRLSLYPGETLILSGQDAASGTVIATSPLEVLIDPFGIVFDSGDGAPVSGSRVTIINVATGQPAEVFGDDGVSRFPSSVVTGSTVTDSGGNVYRFPPGDYRFPFARAGTYRLVVEPPAPYTAPSKASPAEVSSLLRPDGIPYTIIAGSYSDPFVLSSPEPVRIDIPVDRPGAPLVLAKTASHAVAVPGDTIQYRITVRNPDAARSTGAITVSDTLPVEMRLVKNTVRYNGNLVRYDSSPDGRDLAIALPALAPGKSGLITYLLQVRPDAQPSRSLNRAIARDNRGATSPVADAFVRISRDGISDRITIIGRITKNGCSVHPDKAPGVAGVRVMLEDGSYTVTDIDGRYHFEGVMPGTHVVQIDPSTLPADQVPANCTDNARAGKNPISRFVEGRGGALLRVDFRTVDGENKARLTAQASAPRDVASSSAEAAGANIDWLAGQTPGIAWLFPGDGHNPRTKAIRVAIKHAVGQRVQLSANGVPVNPLAFEGLRKNDEGTIAVSLWRAVEIAPGATRLVAQITDANGTVVETLNHTVNFATTPMQAEFIRSKSRLIADGVTRPVIAVRFSDRAGNPVHSGITGDFAVPAPYYAAVETDAQTARQLSGLERARPVWKVDGDDGIAYIELEPTTASGTLAVTLPFRDGDVTRKQQLELWLDPGKRPWTVVGFAAGTIGFNKLSGNIEKLGSEGGSTYEDARIALYAKGRIKGKWLMTLAYDSDKKRDETRFGGTIDPTAYYTIYADRSERRYDAQSQRKIYLKLERPQFYALFGDYETNISEPQLARYVRSFNGVKAEYRNDNIGATAFAADTPFRHRREELQGNGLTGPYALAARDIVPNSERITLETRDRLNPTRIVEARTLIRHVDYDVDYIAGTLRFKEPILSRASDFNPQFIVADYEVDGIAQRATNAGGRVSWTNDKKSLTIGATALHNEDDVAKTNLGGVDVRFKPNANTEIRAEFAASDRTSNPLAGAASNNGTDTAWVVEAEHHGKTYDALAYAREEGRNFGVGQTNGSGSGTRKFGVEGRARMTDRLSVNGALSHEEVLGTNAKRDLAKLIAEYRANGIDFRGGVTAAKDSLADGRKLNSTIAQFGATKRFFDNKLELDAQTEFAIGGKSESIDFPTRHKLGARYAITDNINLIGAYEIAEGDAIKARTARVGFDLKPWTGARILSTMNQQNISEYGPRTYAAFGLAQSLPINEKWTVDFSVDANKTLGGVDRSKVINPLHPVASGGFIGNDGVLTEDFTAITAGATYRSDLWSWTGRAEARSGTLSDRLGINTAVLRQIGQGKAIGGQFSWFSADARQNGPRTETASLSLSWANRPDNSRFSFLEKLELRSDKVKNATYGDAGPIGGAPLLISGDATSQRVINSLSINWSPVETRDDDTDFQTRSEVSLFWGARYVKDKFGEDDIKGLSNVFGIDARLDAGRHFDLGLSGTVRQNPGGRAISWSGGPTISASPIKNSYITIGYNVVGFRDKDFEESRYTKSGPFLTVRLKFDENSLSSLGLGRRK